MTTLDEQARARLIAELALLGARFPDKQVGHLPKAGKQIAYVSHANVVRRLNEVCPTWTYTIDREFEHAGDYWLLGTMTIEGVARSDYGTGHDPLEATSHLIRRLAMRFGVALDLWIGEEQDTDSAERTPGRARPLAEEAGGASTQDAPPAEPVAAAPTQLSGLCEHPVAARVTSTPSGRIVAPPSYYCQTCGRVVRPRTAA